MNNIQYSKKCGVLFDFSTPPLDKKLAIITFFLQHLDSSPTRQKNHLQLLHSFLQHPLDKMFVEILILVSGASHHNEPRTSDILNMVLSILYILL